MTGAAAWLTPARLALEAGRAAILVRVMATRGSTPREAGAAMLVTADDIAGTIGGGRLELDAIETARMLLARPVAGRLTGPQPVALGPALGQCCGGEAILLWERLVPDDLAWLDRVSQAAPGAVAVTPPSGARLLMPEDAAPPPLDGVVASFIASAREIAFDAASGVLLDRPVPTLPSVTIFGAGHVSRALLPILATLPLAVAVVEGRPGWLPADAPPSVRLLPSAAPALDVDLVPPGGAVLVMTHDHGLDLEIVDAALSRPDLAFLGLIGSATKRARFVSRLRARGHDHAAIARLVCPIGVSGVGGKTPAIIAVAVAAQLLQVFGPQRAHEAPGRKRGTV